jgi:hypothetical protein
MEAELNSPMATMAPGQTYAMDTKWYPARTGKEFAGVAEGGLIGEPLLAVRTAAGVRIRGSFGVFLPGQVIAHFMDVRGVDLATLRLGNAEPAEPLNLSEEVKAPLGTLRVKVSVEGEHGENRGVLGETAVTGIS